MNYSVWIKRVRGKTILGQWWLEMSSHGGLQWVTAIRESNYTKKTLFSHKLINNLITPRPI